MPIPKEVLDTVAGDVTKAEASLADLKDIVADMKLSGMDTAKHDVEVADLTRKIRTLKTFYELRKAKP
ncbi:hypothetical protein ES703_28415 [subsurface metagenome]